MMKKYIFSLALLCGFYAAHSQHIINSVDFTQHGSYAADVKKMMRLDDSSFILVKEKDEKETEIIKYTSQLEEVFSIIVESPYAKPSVVFSENLHRIIVIQYEKEEKKDFTIKAAVYNAEDGAFIQSRILLENLLEAWPAQFSLNKDYFYLRKPPAHEGQEPIEINMYSSSSLELLGMVDMMLQRQEKLLCQKITNQGELLLGVIPKDEKSLKFEIYGQNGSLKKSIVKAIHLGKNEYIDDVIYRDQASKQGKLIITHAKRGILKGIEMWQLDYDMLTIASLYKVAVDKMFVKENIYRHVHPSMSVSDRPAPVLKKGYQKRGPSKLKSYTLKDVFIDEQDNVVTLLEQLTVYETTPSAHNPGAINKSYRTARIYSGGNILLMAFDRHGAYKWSNLIERSVSNATNKSHAKMDNLHKPEWSGLKAVAYKTDNELKLVSWETKGWTSSYVGYRKIDWQTGEMKLAQPLINEANVNINTNYVAWLNNRQIVLLNMKGVNFALLKNDIKLQVVEEDTKEVYWE